MTGYAAILAALITVLFAGIALESYKRHRDLQGVASALAGEIFAIVHISRKREHAKNFAILLANLRAGQTIEWPDVTGGDPSQDDPIIKSSLDRVGLLPSNIPERIATFYSYMRGIRIDIMNLSKGTFKDPHAQANIISADLVIWDEASKLADDLWRDLRNIAATPWPPISVAQSLTRRLRRTANSARINAEKLIPQILKSRIALISMRKTTSPQQIAGATSSLSEALSGNANTADLFSAPFRGIVTEIANFIEDVSLPNTLPMFDGNREKALRHLLVDFQTAVCLERASRFIFGSQIDTLIFLEANNGLGTKLEALRYYEAAKVTRPDIYTNYPFEGWLGFLANNHLITVNGDVVKLTAAGRAIVQYMNNRGYLSPRPTA
jgi:hypothetical protein